MFKNKLIPFSLTDPFDSKWWKLLIGIIVIIVFGMWWGVPVINKWRADNLVDQLCAKDGGTEIYEAIKLSAEKFNTYWLANLPNVKYAEANTDYYYASTKRDIQGNSSSSHVNDLVIWRSVNEIVRAVDKKTMAKLVSYTRRGGDPIGPWHPTHYTCPNDGFSRDVVMKN